ncbi:MAG: nucleotidyl transferase AbiEii/AbiGii toxin family protein [Methanoregula sp.]|nr:nucleotidyl transferase AbiEii/AbiGii toxin family protein [Methanoregula sp.]
MIPDREIKEKARESGVPPSTIERDYAQNWLLMHLSPINMALKGGTGIRKVFIEHYRFSDDLDFTLLEPVDKETLQASVRDAAARAREESGIQFEEDVSIIETVSGFRATAKFRILHSSTITPINIDLDLTDPDNEQVFLPVHVRPVFHHYSDRLEASVTAYALEEIMAEKIRSLFQRTRPRDLYDLWQLADRVNRDDVKSILLKKCEYKGVVVDLPSLNQKRDQFAAAWNVSLRHQLREIPDFNEAFEKIQNELEEYSQTPS